MREPQPGHHCILHHANGGGRLFIIGEINNTGISEKAVGRTRQAYMPFRGHNYFTFFHNDAAARVCAKRLSIRRDDLNRQKRLFEELAEIDFAIIINHCKNKGNPDHAVNEI